MWGPPRRKHRGRRSAASMPDYAGWVVSDGPVCVPAETGTAPTAKIGSELSGSLPSTGDGKESAKDMKKRPAAFCSSERPVQKRPAVGLQKSPSQRRSVITNASDATNELQPGCTSSHAVHQEVLHRTAASATQTFTETTATSTTTDSSDRRSLSPAVIQAIDANIAVHFPSLPRAPSEEFHKMIGDIVARGNVTLADGLQQAEHSLRLSSGEV